MATNDHFSDLYGPAVIVHNTSSSPLDFTFVVCKNNYHSFFSAAPTNMIESFNHENLRSKFTYADVN